MRTVGLMMALVEFILVVGVSLLFPSVGAFVIAPMVAVAVGAAAGWLTAQDSDGSPDAQGAGAGAIAGLGAMIGTMVALSALGIASGRDPMLLGLLTGSEQTDPGSILYWIGYAVVAMGGIGGMIAGALNMALSAFAGLITGLIGGSTPDSSWQRTAH